VKKTKSKQKKQKALLIQSLSHKIKKYFINFVVWGGKKHIIPTRGQGDCEENKKQTEKTYLLEAVEIFQIRAIINECFSQKNSFFKKKTNECWLR